MSARGKSKIWTPEAIEILRQMYPKSPANDIADVIGCSDCTVLLKARELGLKRADDFHRNNFCYRYVGKGKYKRL